MKLILKYLAILLCLVLTMSGDIVWESMEGSYSEQLIRWVILGLFLIGFAGFLVLILPRKEEKVYICDRCGWSDDTLKGHVDLLMLRKCMEVPRLNPKYKKKREMV